MKILVVDDDRYIRQLVSIHLTKAGYLVRTAEDAQQAQRMLEKESVELAIVDVMMPGMDGFALTKILTQVHEIPVILLTAKGQLADKEKGFLSGTDDYLVKPFEPKELLFRVAVIARRLKRSRRDHLQIRNLSMNRENFEVMIDEETLLVPLKEFEILFLLLSRANHVVPRRLLIEQVWGTEFQGNESTLNTHINRIRDRLKRHGAHVKIHTIRGMGYKIEAST